MKIYGQDGSWYVIPECETRSGGNLLERMAQRGVEVLGRPIRLTKIDGHYCVEIANLADACEVGGYLELMSTLVSTESN